MTNTKTGKCLIRIFVIRIICNITMDNLRKHEKLFKIIIVIAGLALVFTSFLPMLFF